MRKRRMTEREKVWREEKGRLVFRTLLMRKMHDKRSHKDKGEEKGKEGTDDLVLDQAADVLEEGWMY